MPGGNYSYTFPFSLFNEDLYAYGGNYSYTFPFSLFNEDVYAYGGTIVILSLSLFFNHHYHLNHPFHFLQMLPTKFLEID